LSPKSFGSFVGARISPAAAEDNPDESTRGLGKRIAEIHDRQFDGIDAAWTSP